MNTLSKKDAQDMPAIQKPIDLRCEYGENPVGIDSLCPRFSWVLRHNERGQTQSAYQILVASTEEALLADSGDNWDSGKVASDKSVNVSYAGKPLASAKTYYWKVRWWDNAGQVSPFSQIATFDMGLLSADDWKAKWIGGGDLLRTRVKIDRPLQRARAYICGLGYYELRINGGKVGDHVLDPGWTDYDKLVLYSTYDITNSLLQGENAVGVMLGGGRYFHKVYSANLPSFKHYENASPKVILQLELEFSDSSKKKMVVSDTTWKVASGPIIENDLYDGETYDARLEKEGWDSPGYDDSEWAQAEVVAPPAGRLVSQAPLPPIKAIKNIQPVSLSNPKPGVSVYDFGQNFAGWVRLKVNGPRGAEVKLRHAELLDSEGMINPKTLDKAEATDTYILKGKGREIYEPRFTYHGFRYVEVTGFPGTPNLDSIEGVVVNSAVAPVGGFQCSNSLINKIHKAVTWGQLSNLMSIPTDNCQRSERMGWLGDAQLTAEEAIYNFDMAAFYTKYTRDIKESQKEDGSLPNVVPPFWNIYPADPAWGTACIVIPWRLYLYYGDQRILEENYQVMKDWVNYLRVKSGGELVKESEFGDWCSPGTDRPMDSSKELVSAWRHYQDVTTLSRVAHILGKSAEAEKYDRLSAKIKQTFNKEFIREIPAFPEHIESSFFVYGTGSQTCHILPLYSDIVPEDKRETILKKLLEDIERTHSCHLTTGIVGTKYALDTLTKYGRADLAFTLATQTSYPSWGYMLREGATTLWERWEYLDGAGINSHNHIMFGTIDAWFYKVLAGINIDPSHPGFQRFTIKPYVIGDLDHVSASVQTIRGLVSSSWRKEKDSLTLDVLVPVNSQAKVSVPLLGLEEPVVRENKEAIYRNGSYVHGVAGISSGTREDSYATFEVGSGSYSFWIGESPQKQHWPTNV
jgi:alpha-L-rhamnosidase